MKEFDPADKSASIVSVTDRVRPLAIGMPVMAVHFLGGHAAFVGAEENVALVSGDGEISAGSRPWRRHPLRGLRRRAHRDGWR